MLKEARIYVILIVALIVVTVVIWISMAVFNSNESANTNTSYITVKDENTSSFEMESRCPTISLDSDDAKEVNDEIEREYNSTVSSGKESFDFDYAVNKDYLSLVTFYIYLDRETNNPDVIINTYNFDLDSGALVNDSDLLDDFSYSYSDISNSLEKEMKSYYQQEVDSMYFSKEECDYNCFLDLRGIDNYTDNVKLFVRDNKLVFYRKFNVYSRFLEDQFYRSEDFLFEIE